jgi:hypothetical protein
MESFLGHYCCLYILPRDKPGSYSWGISDLLFVFYLVWVLLCVWLVVLRIALRALGFLGRLSTFCFFSLFFK